MERKRSVNSQVVYNVLSTAILTGINFLTIPIFTTILGAEQYGNYSVFYSWASILMPFMGMQTHTSLAIARYDFENDYSGYKKNILLEGTAISTGVFFVVMLFSDSISRFLGYTKWLLVVMLLFAFNNYIVNFESSLLLYDKNAKTNFVLSLVLAVLSSGLSYIFITKSLFSPLYVNRVYGVVLPYVIIGTFLWIYIFIKNRGLLNFHYWKYAFAYGFPIVLHLMSHEALGQSNRLMLQYLGYAGITVGIYSFYQSFNSILSIILNALNTSWVPFYNDDLNEGSFERLKIKVKNYIELFSVLACGFVLLSREVCYLFVKEEYWSGMNIIPIFVISVYLTFMYQFPVNFEYFNKKTKMISIGTICAGITNILFNYLLVPKYGMFGAAFATVISYFSLYVIHTIIANKIKEMRFHVHLKDFIKGIAMLSVSIVMFYTIKELWFIRWIIGALLGIYEIYFIYKRRSIF